MPDRPATMLGLCSSAVSLLPSAGLPIYCRLRLLLPSLFLPVLTMIGGALPTLHLLVKVCCVCVGVLPWRLLPSCAIVLFS